MNPFQLLQMFKGGANPMGIVNMLIGQNPQAAAAWKQANQMASGKKPEELKNILTNMAKERGMSLDDITKQVKQLGINLPE